MFSVMFGLQHDKFNSFGIIE